MLVSFAEKHSLCMELVSEMQIIQLVQKEINYSYATDQGIPLILQPTKFEIEIGTADVAIPEQSSEPASRVANNRRTVYFQLAVGPNFQTMDQGQHHHLFVFSSEDRLIKDLLQHLLVKCSKKQAGLLYTWSEYNSCYLSTSLHCAATSNSDLQGLDEIFAAFDRDLQVLIGHDEMMVKLGLSSGTNYQLHGPPGTGKSSFFKAIAHRYGIPIC